ncbi:hypothetical protein ACJMK2_011051 [Sinanodonta woodiana]|uniref:RanBD1 domain-containing protein n=1 Tax=Sinanodonta woodiana TaxID=1069815 RepID=A0ABD3V3M9_SINWO
MTNTDPLVDKKMTFLGVWVNEEVNTDVMGTILQFIQHKKGTIVKLQLRRDGLRILKNKIIIGLVLQHFIPLNSICIITYNHKVPRMMFVVSRHHHLYQISTFKCENASDAGEFIEGFRNIKTNLYTATHQKNDGKHVTFDLMGTNAKSVLATKNAEAKKEMIKVNKSLISILKCSNVLKRASELSENSSHSVGESAPRNVTGIKEPLEKSTGNNPEYKRKSNNEDAFNAVLVLGEEKEIDTNSKTVPQPRTENEPTAVQNGHTKDGLVRISVPNYSNGCTKHRATGGHVLILPTIFEEKF